MNKSLTLIGAGPIEKGKSERPRSALLRSGPENGGSQPTKWNTKKTGKRENPEGNTKTRSLGLIADINPLRSYALTLKGGFQVKIVLTWLAVVFALSMPLQATPIAAGLSQDEIAHGGGCRKSSPAGQCCHMDNSTGVVHCH